MIDLLNKICETTSDAKILNTFKLDSKCFAMSKPSNEEELVKLINYLKENSIKYMVLGNASNVILPPYYDGVVIKLDKFDKYEINDDYVYTESGVMINKLANILVNSGYAGLDFAVGVPGTIGGSVYGNAGCYGSSISEVLISARVYDGEKIIELTNEEMKFAYRYSILKDHKNYIVLSCKFRIHKSDINELKELTIERQNKRMNSQDLLHPSNGSVFRNPEGLSSGKLIDDLGLKGYHVNDAYVSNIHANFIINNGHATSDGIIELINQIKIKVKEKYNIDLVLEQEIIE